MKPITKEKIGWGFLATGRIAREFAECLKDVDDAYVAAVGSRTLESAEAFTSVYGGKPYGSYEEMLKDPDVDVVYIATPHPMHEENVIMAANYGKNILCEKPFAVNRAQAERMFEAAAKNDVFIMEGLWSRFFPAWIYVREVLESEKLGKVVSIESTTSWGMHRSGVLRADGRLLNPDLAGGSLLDAGIYSLASASLALGKIRQPKNIYSTMRFEPTGVDSDVEMLLEFDDEVTAHLISSLHRRGHETRICCEHGNIHIPRHRNPDTATITGVRMGEPDKYGRYMGTDTVTISRPFANDGFQFEARAVHDCLRKGLNHCPDVMPEETLTLIGICDTVRAQHGFKYPFEN